MTELADRLRALTPEQRRRLTEGMRHSRPSATTADPADAVPARQSLYFFASAAGWTAQEYYSFVIAAAEQADAAGLHAVWLPERHFVDFGGYSPNPVLLASAIAARTTRIGLRAGSVAAPLHHPVRIAEDWSAVDNLSGGRVGISFASGWHPDDFVLARADFAARREVTESTMRQVRALWQGEPVKFTSTAGTEVEITIQPRPVQPDLPMWLTAAGSPVTFASAGTGGFGIMTALLGQTMQALRENIATYRQAWQQAGHPGQGDVVVMLHAHISERDDMEAFLRPAMHSYLRAFRGQTSTAPEQDEEVLLESAYLNFLRGPSALGSAAKVRAVLGTLADAGVDEVGYLVDFGLPAPEILAALPSLFALGAQR